MNKMFKITLALVVIAVLLLVGFYFAIWRPSDKDYASATASLQDLGTSVGHLDTTLPSIKYPGTVNDTLVSYLEKQSDQYKNSLDSLSKNIVVTRDMNVASIYDQDKDSLTNYQHVVKDLVTGMRKYWSAASSCTYLVSSVSDIKTVSQFDTASKTCTQDIDSAKSAPSTLFTTQFLSKYTSDATKLVDAYRTLVSAGQDANKQAAAKADIKAIDAKISSLIRTQFDLSIESPVSQLQKLQSVVTSQSKAILR